ncbi:hypothetical protein P153DRAFT_382144 [Dothidotthia symphoricarpi CBS 119687]|uniref:Uncharacterized protein n=1 Tax=Dothidotthia symphoricarpi CBS 119687 TaxID=1392245 RepID=A0A6A6AL39_9PLEO|nr:uncharacterized protein P153DRAFT_382144 [Dothidotthia symphoricarpi CBS 119687]KAF2132520.1 hypothetical protein P153DRAFT_382144 [Dothidotthia symphoricarpi CBS 119687]
MTSPASGSSDDTLLARLNALKKSSVSFDTTFKSPVAPASSPKPTNDLAARFARLGSPSPSSSPQPSRTTSTNDARAPIVAPGAPSYLEGIAQGIGGGTVEFNEEDEKSLEELLGELNGAVGERKDWDVSRKEQQDVGKLLKEMRGILPEVQKGRAQDLKKAGQKGGEELTDWENVEVDVGNGSVKGKRDESTDDEEDEGDEGKKKTEDDEADDVIARAMAELEIHRKYDAPSPPPEDEKDTDSGDHKQGQTSTKEDNTDDGALSLPSAPTSLPEDDLVRAQAFEDIFTARLAALSAPSTPQTDALGLPSAPSFHPTNKPPIQSNLQAKLDEEIDTWCIICQDDATLRCMGCDDDLYCQNCWMEGHKGESAGFEERSHKAVLFVRKKKQAAAA